MCRHSDFTLSPEQKWLCVVRAPSGLDESDLAVKMREHIIFNTAAAISLVLLLSDLYATKILGAERRILIGSETCIVISSNAIEYRWDRGDVAGRMKRMPRIELGGLEWIDFIGQSDVHHPVISRYIAVAHIVIIPLLTILPATYLLRKVHQQQSRKPGLCDCGYDLTGNLSGVCPECGKATRDRFRITGA